MVIRPDDKCEGCDKSFWDYEGVMHSCPNCGARFCDDCFKVIREQHEGRCPSCGRKP